MKKVVVLSMGIETKKSICAQLRELIGDKAQVEGYSLNDEISQDFKDSLVVVTSNLLESLVLSKLHSKANYIVARRVINYQHLRNLISIPAGSEVLLVNDHEDSCLVAIEQLKKLGINHIKYYPYYPGIKDYKRLELAVTPGEPQLVPKCCKRVINIGIRQIDITTLGEILNKLDLMKEKGDIISSQFVRDIVNLSRQYNDIAEQSLELKNMFQTIIENSSDGIIYLDTEGNVSVVNEVLASMLGRYKDEIINKHVEDILPVLKNWSPMDVESDIIKLFRKEVVAVKAPVKKGNKIIGYMVSIVDVDRIQRLEHELRRKNRKSEHNAIYSFEDIICKSDLMKRAIKLAKRLSLSNSTILIQGESGTGKEFFAQAIHNFSKREDGPFVPVNFAALPVNLLESELFGYEEGAFTGAKKGGKPGLFEQAHGGTIFLDEIGDAPLEFQARLLRVLQEKQVRRVGGTKLIPIDVRVIAATNKDLKVEVESGNFRQDLFYRLNVLPLYTPNLKERDEDIPLLLEYYLRKFTNGEISSINKFVSQEVLTYLKSYEWPGNVRELVNVIEYLVNIRENNCLITIDDLPSYVISDFKKDSYSRSLYKEKFHQKLRRSIPVSLHSEGGYSFDSNIIWLLKRIKEKEGIGRRRLTELAKINDIELGEGKIRSLMKTMEELGLITIKRGAKGSVITDKGLKVLWNLERDK